MDKIALLFPGQGSQYVGMGKVLCENFAVANKTFEEANEALGFDLKKLCFEGDIKELTKTENTQPALLTMSVAAFRVFCENEGINADFMAGHSLGEFSALTCSGAIKFSDAVKIVKMRGRFMQEAVPAGIGSMAAVTSLSSTIIVKECSKYSREGHIVVAANYNAPDQTVISGHKEAVAKACEELEKLGAGTIPLKVSAPFHSPLMHPAAVKLNEELKKYQYEDLKNPVISNFIASPYEGSEKIIENLTNQIVSSVRWQESMAYIEKQGVKYAIEIGPQTVLRNLMKKNVSVIKAFSYDKEDDVKAFHDIIKEEKCVVDEGNDNGINFISRCLGIAVCTKNENWDNEEYKKGVTDPYKKVQKMLAQIEKEGKKATTEQMREALNMLKSVFITKKTPLEEQVERFNQVFDETGTRNVFVDFKMPAL